MLTQIGELPRRLGSSEPDYRQLKMATEAYSKTFKSLPNLTQVDKGGLSRVQVDYSLEAYYGWLR